MSEMHRPILLLEDNPMDVDLTRRAIQARKLVNPLVVARDEATRQIGLDWCVLSRGPE